MLSDAPSWPTGFRPRPKQQQVLAYRGGKMGVAAVPGSGKTMTLSCLAAALVAEAGLADDQEVLVVTFANSSVDNFNRRLALFMRQRGLLPGVGYRVRTLHGLAHDIVRQQPGLVGLPEDFVVVDERQCQRLLEDATHTWLRSHPELAEAYRAADLDAAKLQAAYANDWLATVKDAAQAVIALCKDRDVGPAELRSALDREQMPLLAACCDIYESYQRGLAMRGGVDFQDLIRLALQVLALDPLLLARLQAQWPYILEDEAQDSSRAQERILRLLTGPEGNWVRMGDPNQAIYESFTTASPRYLREFLSRDDVQACDLPNSGRCTRSIMSLANRLIDWVQHEHPNSELRDALSPPLIEPSPPGDSQLNPPDRPERIAFAGCFSADEELQQLVRSLSTCLKEHADQTVAVLVPDNQRGARVVESLQRAGLPCLELLRNSRSARQAAAHLAQVTGYLAQPLNRELLARAVRLWADLQLADAGLRQEVKTVARALQRYPFPEAFPYPAASEPDCLETLAPQAGPDLVQALDRLRELLRRWLAAAQLPVDQMLITLAQDLFTRPSDLAVAQQLAVSLHRRAEANPSWRLPEFATELDSLAESRHAWHELGEEEAGFDPDEHRGVVVVTTYHKAKGLEWDRVYLTSLNNYDFPSADDDDQFRGERSYLRGGLNLQAEAEAQLLVALGEDDARSYEEGMATREQRLDHARDRLRLLYVGITRARKELVLTWNKGKKGNLRAARAFEALATWWKEQQHAPTG